MAIVGYILDPANPPELSPETIARLDVMSEKEIEPMPRGDPDNPPLTEAELDRTVATRTVRLAREASGLSQAKFAKAFRINVSRLRDLEQGRSRPDSGLVAYLRVIEREPEAVRRALDG